MENTIFFNPPNNLEAALLGLKDQQKIAVANAIKYLADPDPEKPYFLIQGAAGTGKTTSIKHAIMHIPKHRMVAAAPSHFAKNILQQALGDGYRVMTIAKLLGKVLTTTDSYDKELRKRKDLLLAPIEKYDVIILDEISMLKDEESAEILNYTKNKKVLLLGDYFQLMPVGQELENVFFKNMSEELTEPVRFTGPIYTLSMHVRAELDRIRSGFVPNVNIITETTERVSLVDASGSGYIFLNNLHHLLITYIKRFHEGDKHKSARILAYRNKTIDYLNKNIRYRLYGKDPAQFEEGEIVISNGGFTAVQEGGYKQSIKNGEIFEVSKIVPVKGPYGLDCVMLTLKERAYMSGIIVVAESSRKEYEKKKREKENAANDNRSLWRSYHAFVDSFAYFNFGYSTTIHKAQGSSITNTFIMEEDLMDVRPISYKEKFHVLYTAITRSTFRVYIYSKKQKADNTQLNREYLKIKPR